MFQRSLVQIPALYTGWTFFRILLCSKNLQCVLQKTKIYEKEAGDGPFKTVWMSVSMPRKKRQMFGKVAQK